MLFALIFTGVGLCKIGIFNKTVNLGINKMVLYFAFPCMITYKIGTMEMVPGLGTDFFLVVVLGLACFMMFTAVSAAYCRLRGMEDRMSRAGILSMQFPNNGFIGYPVALIFMGQPGLFLMIAHGAVVYNLYVFTYGITYLRRGKPDSVPLTPGKIAVIFLRLLKNPIILSIAAGIAILVLGIPMDNIVGDYLSAISEMASPLAMIYVGSAIGEDKVLTCVKDKMLWEISFVKLILLPVITGLVCFWLPVSAMVKATLILGAAFPCATVPVMLAQQEDMDYSQAGGALLLSTLLSVLTLPAVMKILTMILPL